MTDKEFARWWVLQGILPPMHPVFHVLHARVIELEAALRLAIPWIGEPRDGPDWATPTGKVNNQRMAGEAFETATRLIEGERGT